MAEKVLNVVAKVVLPSFFMIACATAGSLFAHCIELKIQENVIKKMQKETKTAK